MADPDFLHLRVHSEYSVVDSIVRIDSLVAAAKADRQPAVAITDLGNVFGWIKFYKAARAAGVQPILGADVWITNEADRDKAHRLLLIVSSQAGYLRLCELLSRAWLENSWRERGEIRREWLGSTDGLIALSGAAQGDVGEALLAGRAELAAQLASDWARRFPNAFYLELQRVGRPTDESHVRLAAALAARLGLPIVATNPVQFVKPDEYAAHEARVCIAEGELLANPSRTRRFSQQMWFRSQADMVELFGDLPSALANTVEIARRCHLTMSLGKARLPDFQVPEGWTLDDWLRAQSHEGLQRRFKVLFPPDSLPATEIESKRGHYAARIDYECDTIVQMGFSGYFLIVADFINWAKQNDVPVGPGRGSGAGSLVAYALGVTDIDPIPYALLFERFLNPERVSMPDFDIDFCQDKRWRVIEYVRQKYGAQAVSQIATFGTMASKAVIRDAGRVLDLPYNFCDQLSKLIPVVQNKPLSLVKAREAEPQLREREEKEDDVRGLLEIAGPLEDLARNVGMHAGGVLIAPGRLTDFCPLYKAPGTDAVISQYDKDDVEAVGLVKFDFLGLRNLTILDLAVRYVREAQERAGVALGDRLDLARLAFDDPKAYQVLKVANTTAIFQLESDGMKKLLKKLEPDRFEDIIAALALYRPGPLGSGMVDDFILRKKGQQAIDFFHPDLKATLEPTYGVIVYQEQVMQISQTIGGYTLGGADLLRRAMGKKKPEEMAKYKGTFLSGAKEKGYGAALAEKLFDLMAMFAEYGFNKSHTAAYAVVTYHTAWLKAHWPAEFMAATLSSDMDDTDKVMLFVNDARENHLTVLGPDVNASVWRFVPVGGEGAPARTIRYGLGGVKGVGAQAVEHLIARRDSSGPFKDLFDWVARVDRRICNRRCMEALIRAGALDSLGPAADRARLLATLPHAIDCADQADAQIGQDSLFGAIDATFDAPRQWVQVAPWTERQRLREEKAALGFYFSGHLFDAHRAEVQRMVRARLVDLAPSRDPQWLAGTIAGLRPQMTRRGKMLIVTLDDGSAKVEISIFAELHERYRALLREDEFLLVQGRISNDEYAGGLRVSADRVLDLTGARMQFARRLRIQLNGQSHAGRLHDLLAPYQEGPPAEVLGCPVEIEYHTESARCRITLGEAWRVRPDDALLGSLRQWLTADSAELLYE